MKPDRLTDAQLIAIGDVLDLIAIAKRSHRSMRALIAAHEIPIETGKGMDIESQIRALLEAERKLPSKRAA